MASMKKTGTGTDVNSSKEAAAMDAVELLEKDHSAVRALFEQLEQTKEDDQKVALAQQICRELSLHAECEEAIFYPAVRKALGAESGALVDEASVEHRSLKTLIEEIDGSSPDDPLFDANLMVLKEYVEHHVKEEESEMFPGVKGKLDLDAIGAQLAAMKAELEANAGEPRTGRVGTKARVRLPSSLRKSGARPPAPARSSRAMRSERA